MVWNFYFVDDLKSVVMSMVLIGFDGCSSWWLWLNFVYFGNKKEEEDGFRRLGWLRLVVFRGEVVRFGGFRG